MPGKTRSGAPATAPSPNGSRQPAMQKQSACSPRGSVKPPFREARRLREIWQCAATVEKRGIPAQGSPRKGRRSIARGGASREAASGTPGGAPKTDRRPEMAAIAGGGGEGRAEARPQPSASGNDSRPRAARRHLSMAPVARRSRRPCGAPVVFYRPQGFRALTRPPPLAMLRRPLPGASPGRHAAHLFGDRAPTPHASGVSAL